MELESKGMGVTLHISHIKMTYLGNIINNHLGKGVNEATTEARAMDKGNGFKVQDKAKSAGQGLMMFMRDMIQENKIVLKAGR